jgi:hypothetical protein
MQVRTGSLSFAKAKDIGPRTSSATVVFEQNRRISQAVACLTGFSSEFSDGDGHQFGKLDVQLTNTVFENTVTVTATYGLRDNGESYDNNYQGTVYYAVLADELPV